MKRFILWICLVFLLVGCNKKEETEERVMMYIKVNGYVLSTTLEENSATKELVKRLPISIEMEEYGGFEKVGSLGENLPTDNSSITTNPCEFVLYDSNKLVIFYGSNTWSYTRLGKINDVTKEELKNILGEGNVTITLTLDK